MDNLALKHLSFLSGRELHGGESSNVLRNHALEGTLKIISFQPLRHRPLDQVAQKPIQPLKCDGFHVVSAQITSWPKYVKFEGC